METLRMERQKVFDPVLRIIHWFNGLAIVLLLATAYASELFEKGLGEKVVWTLHIFTGYGLSAGLAARVLWGVAGPRHARFSALWHPRAWAAALRMRFTRDGRFGHDPYASLAYLALYAALFVMAGTGLALAATEHGTGPLTPWLFDRVALGELVEEPHEAIHVLIIGFIVLHLGALVVHEWRGKTPVAQAMVSGYQYRETKE
jgi:cytochrome b